MTEAELKMELKAIKATKALFKNIFVVYYEIIGSRCNGSYLVKANNKREAKSLVRAQYDDYIVRNSPDTFVQYAEDMGMDAFEEFSELMQAAFSTDPSKFEVVMPSDIEMGFVYQIECGT